MINKNIKDILFKDFVLDDYKKDDNLNLGCGNKPMKGYVNVDLYNEKFADQIVDLNKTLPWDDETYDLIYSDNVFEHVQNLIQLIRECYRVLKKDGYLVIKTPYFKSKHAFVDPTHVHFFTIQSMDYFVNGTYFNSTYPFFMENFKTAKIYLDPNNKSVIKKILSVFAIKKPNVYENSIFSNMFVFHNIVFVLKK